MRKNDENQVNIDDQINVENLDEATAFSGYGTGGIVQKPMESVLHESMIPYTEHVVLDRALPRVEDGLKPVQRRILYSMMQLDLTPDKPYKKSARIVGECMGKFHPHGDASVYDAMVRMSQDFVLRAPLVDGHGNFGSVDGDPAAAMRYTEARLNPLALELLRDLDKDTVRWSLNFDDTLKEPDMLPGRFPNLLVNGATGIAVGIATNIPPHNLSEAIEGVCAYIDNPNIKLEKMMSIIKGPDFPTGGEIIAGDGLKEAYASGKGKIYIRAKVGLENSGDKQSIIISEIPYQVNKSLLLAKIAELKEKDKETLSGIAEIRDESDRNGMRAVIKLKKEADPQKILKYLYKNTNLQVSYSINMVAIAGGKPKLLSLLDIISYYAEYQREVIVRRTKFELNQAKERAEILEGLLIAIKNIDKIIKIIKSSMSVTEAKTRLKETFKFTDRQAQAILDMRLARLVHLEELKIKEELESLKKLIKELEAILSSKKLQFEVVKKELGEIRKKYGTARKSQFLKSDKVTISEIKEDVDDRNFVLLLTAGKTIKKVPLRSYSSSNKTLNDNSSMFDIYTRKLDVVGTDTVLMFTSSGYVLKIEVDNITECRLKDNGVPISHLNKGASLTDTVVDILPLSDENNKILFMTSKGMIKRTSLKDTLTVKSFYQAVKINEGDKLITVHYENNDKQVLMLTQKGQSIMFNLSEVPVQGRISAGVKGINMDEDDSVIFANLVTFKDLVAISDNGFVKRIPISEFTVSPRYRKGLKYFTLSKGGKRVVYASATLNYVAIDFGLKFALLDVSKIKKCKRTDAGNEVIKKKFLDAYDYV